MSARGQGGVSACLAQHHRGDGLTSSLGPASMAKKLRAVCEGRIIAEVEAVAEVGFEFKRSCIRG